MSVHRLARLIVGLLIAMIVAALASTTTARAATFSYDSKAVTRVDAHEFGFADASSTQLSGSREGFASLPVEPRRTSTTPFAPVVATNTGSRGLSNLGGIIEETGTNAAGGRIFTSTGPINQNDFAGIVQSSLMKGNQVSILTGAHGLPNGSLIADASMLADDVAAFGKMPGVSVHDVASMSPAEISAVLQRPGTIIGGFCDSGACLSPYRGG